LATSIKNEGHVIFDSLIKADLSHLLSMIDRLPQLKPVTDRCSEPPIRLNPAVAAMLIMHFGPLVTAAGKLSSPPLVLRQ